MKKISILIPTYNEEENVIPLCNAIRDELKNLPKYSYEILFIDNCSTDSTRLKLEVLCAEDKNVKAIFNVRNFGQFNSPYYGILQTSGDCVITMCADFQDPVNMIPKFIEEWENGYKIVCAIKSKSKENRLMRFFRTCYYKLIKKMSSVDMIEHFTGFGLYDKSFVDVLRKLDDPIPFMRGIVAELGYKRKDIEYTQERRRAGKTKNNFLTLFDAAMLSFTSYTKAGMRIATLLGFALSIISIIITIVYLILKLTRWQSFPMGTAPIILGIFFFGSMELFFTGLLGEYVMSINTREMNRPLVIEEKRINFEEKDEETPNDNILSKN